MPKFTKIITKTGEPIAFISQGIGKQSEPALWVFSIDVETFLYKTYPNRYHVQITARNRETHEVICICPSSRLSWSIADLNMRLNKANEIFQSLLTAITNKDEVWEVRAL